MAQLFNFGPMISYDYLFAWILISGDCDVVESTNASQNAFPGDDKFRRPPQLKRDQLSDNFYRN
jgi:hypothetical protein